MITSPQAIDVSCKDQHDFCQVWHGTRSASIDNAGLLKTMVMVMITSMIQMTMMMTVAAVMMMLMRSLRLDGNDDAEEFKVAT